MSYQTRDAYYFAVTQDWSVTYDGSVHSLLPTMIADDSFLLLPSITKAKLLSIDIAAQTLITFTEKNILSAAFLECKMQEDIL